MKARDWFQTKIYNQTDGPTLDILIYDVIGADFFGGVDVGLLVEEIRAFTGTEIRVSINSPGGSAPDALALYNQLTQNRARVITSNDGMAASAAGIVLVAGQTVRMAENALFMMHDPATIAIGTPDDMRTAADMLEKWAQNIALTYKRRMTETTLDEIRDMMQNETWLNATEAKNFGLIDEIDPEPVAIAAFPFLSNFHNVPEALNMPTPKTKPAPKSTATPKASAQPAPPTRGKLGEALETAAAKIAAADSSRTADIVDIEISSALGIGPGALADLKQNTGPAPTAEAIDKIAAIPGMPPAAQLRTAAEADGHQLAANPAPAPVKSTAADPADPTLSSLQKFIAAFGPNGGVWLSEGKSFDDAVALHNSQQSARIEALETENKALKTRLAAAATAPGTDPAGVSTGDPGQKEKNGFISNIRIK